MNKIKRWDDDRATFLSGTMSILLVVGVMCFALGMTKDASSLFLWIGIPALVIGFVIAIFFDMLCLKELK